MRKLLYTIAIATLALTIVSCSSSTTEYRNIQMPAGSYVADLSSQGTSNGNLWYYLTAGSATPTTLPTGVTSWQPSSIAFNNTSAYVAANGSDIWLYNINSTGGLSGTGVNAVPSPGIIPNWNPIYVAFNHNFGYVVSPLNVSVFAPNSNGILTYIDSIESPTLSNMTNTITLFRSIGFYNGYAYITGVAMGTDTTTNEATAEGIVATYLVNESTGQLTYQESLSFTQPSAILTNIAFNDGYAFISSINMPVTTTLIDFLNNPTFTNLAGAVSSYLVTDGIIATTPTQITTNPVSGTNSVWLPTSITFNNGSAYITNAYTFAVNSLNSNVSIITAEASDISVFSASGGNISYSGTVIPQAGVDSYWDPLQVNFYQATGETGGILSSSIESANLIVDTSTITSSTPATTFTLTNTGTGNVYNINIQPSAPLTLESSNCPLNLESGHACNITVSLTTNKANNAIAESGVLPYTITYYNGTSDNLIIPVSYSIESWHGSLFITESTSNGMMSYNGLESGVLSADQYCQNDINNPHNGYTYKAVISDGLTRTPTTTKWTLYANESYVSVMPNVYNQFVLTTTDLYVFPSDPANCVSLNCAGGSGPTNHDKDTWNGIGLDNLEITPNTCNSWQTSQDSINGTTNRITNESGIAPSITSSQETCDSEHAIMCAAQ